MVTTQGQMGRNDFDVQVNHVKNLLMPLFLMGCFPVDFQEVKRPLRTKSGKRPIEVGKRPIKEGKRPIETMVLASMSVDCVMGCFRAPPPWRKTAPLKGPLFFHFAFVRVCLRLLVLGPFSGNRKSAFVCVCTHSFAFANTPFWETPPFPWEPIPPWLMGVEVHPP